MCIFISSFIHWPHHSQDDFFSPRLQLSISALSPWLFERFGIRSFKRSHRWSLGRQDAVLWLSLMGSCWAACYELKYKKPTNTTNQTNKWCSLTFITVTFLCYVRWMCIFLHLWLFAVCCLEKGNLEMNFLGPFNADCRPPTTSKPRAGFSMGDNYCWTANLGTMVSRHETL